METSSLAVELGRAGAVAEREQLARVDLFNLLLDRITDEKIARPLTRSPT